MGREWWRGGIGALSVFVGLVGRDAAHAGELRAVKADATTVRLLLSEPARPMVHAVGGGSGAGWRLHVDLPRGTRLGGRVPRAVAGTPPLVGLRVGQGEGGVLRVAVDADTELDYRVQREAGGRRIVITLAPLPAAAPPVAAPAAAPAPRRALLRPRIVIDPGHGGRDPGAQGYAVEKDVTLAIARGLATRLRERLGAETTITRADDATLQLAERTARANGEGADLFISIHANASSNPTLHGIETYYLNNTNDRATIRLAAMENEIADVPAAGRRADLRYILSDLVQVGKMEESIALARAVQRGLVDELRSQYTEVADLGVKQGPFYVLVGAYMPCVLVETSFLTHPTEGRRLAEVAYQDAVADGLYAGIARFLADARRARTL